MISPPSTVPQRGVAALVAVSLLLSQPGHAALPAAVPAIAIFLVEWAAGHLLSDFVNKLQGQDGATLKKRLDELSAAREGLDGALHSLRSEQQQLNRAVAMLAARDTSRSTAYEALLMDAAYCSQAGYRQLAFYDDLGRLVLPAHRGDRSAQRELYQRLRAAGGLKEAEFRWAECITGQIGQLHNSLVAVQKQLLEHGQIIDGHTRWLIQIQNYLDSSEGARILEQEGRGRSSPAIIHMHEKSLDGFDLARSVKDVLIPVAGAFGLPVLQYSGTVLADDVIVSLSYECEPSRQIHECTLRLHGPGADLRTNAFGPTKPAALQNLQTQFDADALSRFAADLARGRKATP